MFTHKDIEFKTIFVINCIEQRKLRVSNGELLLEEENDDIKKTLTKMPFQKILALYVIGNITITTPLIDKCKKYNVALIVVKPNLRPVFFWSNSAEANYLLRKRQYSFDKNNISIAKVLIENKIINQLKLLEKTRMKDTLTVSAKTMCLDAIGKIRIITDYFELMGLEGRISKSFFMAYYQKNNWIGRKPRIKVDCLNATLDIGYTILFNFIEAFVRMFGFDIYIGVYHRLWFKRKSLICDLVEPFRCIIDNTIRNGFQRKQFDESDFEVVKNQYYLKKGKSIDYYRVFFNALIEYKKEIFIYIQDYYRCFLRGSDYSRYPQFIIK